MALSLKVGDSGSEGILIGSPLLSSPPSAFPLAACLDRDCDSLLSSPSPSDWAQPYLYPIYWMGVGLYSCCGRTFLRSWAKVLLLSPAWGAVIPGGFSLVGRAVGVASGVPAVVGD